MDQETVEQKMADMGARRGKKALEDAIRREVACETPSGISLAKRLVAPFSDAIEAFVKDAVKGGKPGPKATAALLLKDIDPKLVAYITTREVINGAVFAKTLSGVARLLAGRLAEELDAAEFQAKEPFLYASTMKKWAGKGARRQAGAIRGNILQNLTLGQEGVNRWTVSQQIGLGTKLIELLSDSMGIIHVVHTKAQKNRHRVYIEFTPKIEKWFKRYNDVAAISRPFHLPTTNIPKDWDALRGGAYYTDAVRAPWFISRPHKERLEALNEGDLSEVYSAVNNLQHTAWKINRDVLGVMWELWDRGLEHPCVPPLGDQPIPPPPNDHSEKGSPERKRYRHMVRLIHQSNSKNKSLRFDFYRVMQLADMYRDEDPFYFPYILDFRGRVYPLATALHPQAGDPARSLLTFSYGKPLDAKGIFWLGVHGANVYGEDKVSLQDRYQWALRFRDTAQRIADDPFTNQEWTEADKPWCFLAWCFEWAKAEEGFVSSLPIALDGSCNGLQHFSAMLRDPVGGASTNLVPADTPSDIYQDVADRVNEKLAEFPVDDERSWMAQTWLVWGVDRKICKRPVMVLPYGGTYASCMAYVRDAFDERVEKGAPNPFGEERNKACAWLARIVWDSISEVVIAAKEAMAWLQKVAAVMAAANKPMKFTTPTGFVMFQDYKETKKRRIKTRFAGNLIYLTNYEENPDELSKAKNRTAISPNFVHSLDASALVRTINASVGAGLREFAFIHDSYATTAADTQTLAEILRQEFVAMYQTNDVLVQFRNECVEVLTEEEASKLPPLPRVGNLDLSKVLQSPYFFA